MSRWGPQVLPTVQKDSVAAAIEGLRGGFDLGSGIVERQRRRRMDERQEGRQDQYLDIQKTYATEAQRNAAISRAGQGYRVGDPTSEDAISVEGGGYIDFENSVAARQQDRQYDTSMRGMYEKGNYEEMRANEIADAIERGDDSFVMSRSPQTYGQMRQGPVEGSEEWKATERFRTDEAIRRDRARPRSSGGGGGSPPSRFDDQRLDAAIDDARMEITQRRQAMERLRPPPFGARQPSDTAGFGAATDGLATSERRYDELIDYRNQLRGLPTGALPPAASGSPPANAQGGGSRPVGPSGPPMSAASPDARGYQEALLRIERLQVPGKSPAENEAIKAQLRAKLQQGKTGGR